MHRLLAFAFLGALHVMAADVYTFSTLPTDGTIGGPPGSTIGWGYSLQNQSTTDWLVTTGLNAGGFQGATPNLIFDFPDLAPGVTVTVPFDLTKSAGLFELTWDASATPFTTNSGTFILNAEWWSGDPLNGGAFVATAANASQSYTATATPEPQSLALFGLGLLAISIVIRRRRALDIRRLFGWGACVFVISLGIGQHAAAQVYGPGQPQPLVVPVQVRSSDGVIVVGNQPYTPNVSAGLHVVTVDRTVYSGACRSGGGPKVIADRYFTDSASANNYFQSLNSTGNIVLVSAFGSYSFPASDVSLPLLNFGATSELTAIHQPFPFAFVGNEGLNQAQAHQVGGGRGDLSGYLGQDANCNYSFIQPDYLRFDLTTDGTIRIGSQTYPKHSGDPGGCDAGPGGLNVVVVDRTNPESTPRWYTTYCTNSGQGLDGQSWANLHNDLARFLSDEGSLVFIASYGPPISSGYKEYANASVKAVGLDVRQFGGYYETLVDLGETDTYSLVGSAPPPNGIPGAKDRAQESSTLYPGKPSGELHGVLGRTNRGNWYSPIVADPTTADPTTGADPTGGVANLNFYKFIGGQPQGFPALTSTQLNQLQSISQQLCTCANIRDLYWDTLVDVDTWESTVENMTDSDGKDCPENDPTTDFCIVRAQLLTEFGYVADVRKLAKSIGGVFTQSGTQSLATILNVYNDVQNDIQPPAASNAVSIIFDVGKALLGVGSALAASDLKPAMGLFSTAFTFATGLANDLKGDSTTSLSTTVGQLQTKALANLNAQQAGTGTLFNLVYQDWGRLQKVGGAISRGDPGWTWDGNSTTPAILDRLTPLVERSYYRSIMASVYAVGRYQPGSYNYWSHLWAAHSYYDVLAPGQHGEAWQPFDGFVSYTYPYDPDPYSQNSWPGGTYEMLTSPTQTLLTDNGYWLGVVLQSDPSAMDTYGGPSWSTLAHLFWTSDQPLVNGYVTPGLAVYRPEFFENWFPRVNCAPSGNASNGDGPDSGEGCNWSSAAPLPESFPNTLSSVAVKASASPNTGNQTPVSLALTNNGTVDLTNITLKEVSVRVLGGIGNPQIVGQTFPVEVGSLTVGESTQAHFNLQTGGGPAKVLLTATGTMTNPAGEISQFSQGQVVILQ